MSQITKHALEQSLKSLLLEKPLNKITVTDITQNCGINRMTFYYHFKDIYDLVEWVGMQHINKALQYNNTYHTWQEGLLEIYNTIQANKPYVRNVERCVGYDQIEKFLKPFIHNYLMNIVNEKSVNMAIREEDKAFIVKVYSYAFVGLILDWIKDGMKEEPKTLVNRFALVIQNTLVDALERFQVNTTLSNVNL